MLITLRARERGTLAVGRLGEGAVSEDLGQTETKEGEQECPRPRRRSFS